MQSLEMQRRLLHTFDKSLIANLNGLILLANVYGPCSFADFYGTYPLANYYGPDSFANFYATHGAGMTTPRRDRFEFAEENKLGSRF